MNIKKIQKIVPQLLVLIGIIIIVIHAISGIKKYLAFNVAVKKVGDFIGTLDEFLFKNVLDSILSNSVVATLGTLINSIIGLIIATVLTYYFVKVSTKPVKNSYVIITILGGLAVVFNFGLGGLFVIAGGLFGANYASGKIKNVFK